MNAMTWMQPVWILSAALLGILEGGAGVLGKAPAFFIEPSLMALLFFVFLSVGSISMKDALRNRRFALTALLINFVWTPLFAWGLCLLFFGNAPDLQIGLMMLLVTPCTDWYLVFTKLAGGNTALGASILPTNLCLQIFLMPVYLFLFLGNSIPLSPIPLLAKMAMVLFIPLALSLLLKCLGNRTALAARCRRWLTENSDPLQLLFLCAAVFAMFAAEGHHVLRHSTLFWELFLPLLLFFAVNYILVQGLGRPCRMKTPDLTALHFTTLARNSPLALAIAAAAFPDHPLISLALVIGPLIELPVLTLIANRIRIRHPQQDIL